MAALPFCHRVFAGPRPKSPHYFKELNTLGDHIRKRRLDLGLMQKEAAEQIGVSDATIYNWERNATSPTAHAMPAVLRFLGYDPFPPADALGQRLFGVRLRFGLSQEQMARRLGVDETTYRKLEHGRAMPNERHRIAITALFKTAARPNNGKARLIGRSQEQRVRDDPESTRVTRSVM